MDSTKATALWKTITNEMMQAKRVGMSNKELAVFIDKQAPEILDKALRAACADGLEAAAKIIQEGRFMQDAQAVSAIRQHAKEMGHE